MATIEEQLDGAIARNYARGSPQIVVQDENRSYRLNPTPERLAKFKADYIKACAAHPRRRVAEPWYERPLTKMSDAERAKLLTKLAAEGCCDE